MLFMIQGSTSHTIVAWEGNEFFGLGGPKRRGPPFKGSQNQLTTASNVNLLSTYSHGVG